MKNIYTIGVFALIFNAEGQLLLAHRNDSDLWDLPGGGLDPDETPEEGVIREVREEVKLEVVVDHVSGIYRKSYDNDLMIAFVCKITAGKPGSSNEAREVRFFDVDKLPENTIPNVVAMASNEVEKEDKGKVSIETLHGPRGKDLLAALNETANPDTPHE